jgi:hypothetical protein
MFGKFEFKWGMNFISSPLYRLSYLGLGMKARVKSTGAVGVKSRDRFCAQGGLHKPHFAEFGSK